MIMNNQREFKLPSVEDLDKDQDIILRLPESGQFLVTGGPGTGKSVVSLIRRNRVQRSKNYVFLVYNHVLMRSTKQMVEGEMNGNTWNRWFIDEFKNLTDEYPPRKSGSKEIDFDNTIIKLQEHFQGLEISENDLNFIIDEGQDMPPEFYNSLIEMGFINFFVVADQNQQITSQKSSILELEQVLVVEKKYELIENYRNTYEIALFAQQFYSDPATLPPKLPSPEPQNLTPIKLHEYENTDAGFKHLIKRILAKYSRNPKYLIGIFTLSNETRNKYFNALNNFKNEMDLSEVLVSSYSSGGSAENIDFTRGGIVVLNSASVKGLEFDEVFIADIDEFNKKPLADELKKIFYVMSSRARGHLGLLRNKGDRRQSKLDDILPLDKTVIMPESKRSIEILVGA